MPQVLTTVAIPPFSSTWHGRRVDESMGRVAIKNASARLVSALTGLRRVYIIKQGIIACCQLSTHRTLALDISAHQNLAVSGI